MDKPESAKMGRPQKTFDFNVFEGLCRLQCTLVEIAGVMGVSEDTVERRCKSEYEATFAEVLKQKGADGRVSIRRAQMRLAESGNPVMLIWLGKQYLSQSDKVQIDVNKLDSDIERELAAITAGSQANLAGEVESETVN